MNTFYEKEVKSGCRHLDEVESKHCAKVLRHEVGNEVLIMDGQGGLFNARLIQVH
ncbi:MAG: 16S rRNA (uracil(1498)-N(3))-methyltransferase, partial [Cytophagales bacterium]|nr:16S rRNA (uracil(1498)-N(3))-methyltransferase [Cytophagales bacterium]